MEATRILPELQSAVLCEDVRREANGNFFVLGIMDGIPVKQVPAVAHRLCVFSRWTAGIGEFIQQIRVIAPDGETEIAKQEVKFQLNNPAQIASNLTLFANTKLEQAGVYHFEVMVDEIMKLKFPLPVVQVQMPNPQGAPQQAPKG